MGWGIGRTEAGQEPPSGDGRTLRRIGRVTHRQDQPVFPWGGDSRKDGEVQFLRFTLPAWQVEGTGNLAGQAVLIGMGLTKALVTAQVGCRQALRDRPFKRLIRRARDAVGKTGRNQRKGHDDQKRPAMQKLDRIGLHAPA